MANYRLHAQDLLANQAAQQNYFRTQITNVSLEGLEELNVLLHLEGISKPLRLTKEQREQMAVMLQSNTYAEWIGHSLALTVSKPASRRRDPQADGNDIELSLLADPATTSSKRGKRSPQPTLSHSSSMGSDADGAHTEEGASTDATEQSPVSPKATQSRLPHTHFSGAGEEYSLPDPSAAVGSGRRRRARLILPLWLQDIGQTALFKQVGVLLGPNFWVALLLFLLVVAVVQFERIATLVPFLWP